MASSIIETCKADDSCVQADADGAVKVAYVKLLTRKRQANRDLAAQERPIADLFDAANDYINNGNQWITNGVHASASISPVGKVCTRLKKMQEVDLVDASVSGGAATDCSTADANGPARKLLEAYRAKVL
mmetsp:Transcript_23183/g.39669  ORF Transcript_23183/g.39669 Transcript_23183/m.39669 type:complete len:130 (-) Transcript_23183:636-1025(-)